MLEKDPFSLYIHIPYCVSKCPYCDFNVHVVYRIPEGEYSETLLRELDFYAESENWKGRNLKSIYFGGGTPSTFSPLRIGRILKKIESLFSFEKEIEITLEANPGKDDSKNFSGYRTCGINRISIGVQSFQLHLLNFLGRLHSADETREALRTVQKAGFGNFNLDLIYANPGQSLSDLKADLEEALSYHPPHLSAYNLTIEEGTPFHRDFQSGKIRPLPEEEEISMAELIDESLSRAGLERYEISNYAKPGYHSRHNVNYWQGGDYLGIGAGAHSYKQSQSNGSFGYRWHNEKNPVRYMEKIRQEAKAVVEMEQSNLTKAAAEFMFLGLRMVQGIAVDEFSSRFGKKPDEFYPRISDWLEEGLMAEKDNRIHLTRRGLLVANAIFVNFV
jgi:oxygen-independent coproporphyrinogen-3 oxidase